MRQIDYLRTGEIIEITIRDFSGRKIDKFRANNAKNYKKVLSIIKHKYPQFNFKPEIKPEESVNGIKKEEKKINWWE